MPPRDILRSTVDSSSLAFKIIAFLMSVTLMVSSFFLKSAWEKISEIEHKVQRLEIDLSVRTASRFDTNDWLSAKTAIDNSDNNLDRRVIRLEESIPVIKELLIKIENKLDVLEDNQKK